MAQYQATPPIPRQLPVQYEPPFDQPWYGIDFGKALARLWQKAFVCSGRASRSEYWYSILFLALINIGSKVLLPFVTKLFPDDIPAQFYSGLGIVVLTFAATVFFMFTISLRRLHDANLSGHWLWLPISLHLAGPALTLYGIVRVFEASLSGRITSLDEPERTQVSRMVEQEGYLLIIVGLACFCASLVIMLVLMCKESNPLGARFDRNPVLLTMPSPAPYPIYTQNEYWQDTTPNQDIHPETAHFETATQYSEAEQRGPGIAPEPRI
ncbi:MAG: DUF805 domain-containing protein [Bifidobacterium psychraerophilum]|uniref:DUF805 domain-containing protein n=1 Tax=Bifidobacterium psychraerophilum TaxID=218140 RepID=UPI0039E962EC